jgi:predicted dehydrogenase
VDLVHEDRFGDIYMARQIERHAGPYSPWFFDSQFGGGGAMMDLGCHCISVIREIFPEREIESVTGLSRTFRHTHGDVEDFMNLQILYAGGAVGVVESNWCHLGGMDSITEVFGSAGNGYADLMKGSGITTFIEKRAGNKRNDGLGRQHPPTDPIYEYGYYAQAEAMIRTVLFDEAPAQSGADGLEILRIMDAGYRSAKNRSRQTKLAR